MKELIEKIKKEIKKKIESYMDLQCDFEDHEMSYQEEILDNHYEGCKSGLETAIDIINKEAKSYNNGWILCSDRLPDFLDNVLVCTKSGGRTIAHLKHTPIEWRDMYMNKIDDVIAWKYLDAPYQQKGE